MGVDEWHRLTNVDQAGRTAECSQCGPVKIKPRVGGGAECATRRREQDARRRKKQGQWRHWRLSDVVKARLSESQVCAICGAAPDVLVVDHDHACCNGKRGCDGCVRDRLCRSCNLGLGYFGEDLDRMVKAVAYLCYWESRTGPPRPPVAEERRRAC